MGRIQGQIGGGSNTRTGDSRFDPKVDAVPGTDVGADAVMDPGAPQGTRDGCRGGRRDRSRGPPDLRAKGQIQGRNQGHTDVR